MPGPFLFFRPMESVKTAPTKRGRPKTTGRLYTLAEMAELLRVDPGLLRRLLDLAPGTIPGAQRGQDGEWQVSGDALKSFLRPLPLEQMVTAQDIAEAWRVPSVHTVYGWLRMRGPNGERLLPSELRLGRRLVPAKAVLALPSRLPPWAARLSFFSQQEAEAEA